MKEFSLSKKIFLYLVICFALSWTGFFLVMFNGGMDSISGKFAIGSCMLLPSISVIFVMLITKEGFKNLYIKPNFKGNIKLYLIAWLAPIALTIFGAALYFLFFPKQFDFSMNSFVYNMIETAKQNATAAELQKIPTVQDAKTILILQLISGIFLSPILNFIPCFGEELGWRGFLLPRLTEYFGNNQKAKIKATLFSGIIWGLWHAPVICMGHNYGKSYPFFPYVGIIIMTIMCITLGTFMAVIFYKTKSIIPAVITHAVINGFAAGPLIFLSVKESYTLLGPAVSGILGNSGFIIIAVVCLIISLKKR